MNGRGPGILSAVLRPGGSRGGRRRWWVHVLGAAVVISLAWSVRRAEGVVFGVARQGSGATGVDRLLARARRAGDLWRDVEGYYEREIAPIERVLLSYRDDPALARRVALALVAEARRSELEPRLLLAVLLVENPWLDPAATSPVGAVGLMQVMPGHRGKWPPCGPQLEEVEPNICHGARIFAHYFREEGWDVERALLRYNGCVHGTNTPDCHTYPYHVYARAGRASILAWLRPRAAAARSE